MTPLERQILLEAQVIAPPVQISVPVNNSPGEGETESNRLGLGSDQEQPLMLSEASHWNTGQASQSPRHKPQPLMEELRPGGGGAEWSDQEGIKKQSETQDREGRLDQETCQDVVTNTLPSVPTEPVLPRRIEEMQAASSGLKVKIINKVDNIFDLNRKDQDKSADYDPKIQSRNKGSRPRVYSLRKRVKLTQEQLQDYF